MSEDIISWAIADKERREKERREIEIRKQESIDHPSHYGGDTVYETIKVIDAWRLNFNLGNAVKYISRAGKKDKSKTLEDLKKARWYLDREIKSMEQE